MNWRKLTASTCAFLLAFSFGLHTIQVNHTHYSVPAAQTVETHSHTHTHDGVAHTHTHIETETAAAGVVDFSELNEKMHMADKKLFVFVVELTLLFSVFFISAWLAYQLLSTYILSYQRRRRKCVTLSSFSYLQSLFAIGVLNPKLY